jgi:hypothetical protein
LIELGVYQSDLTGPPILELRQATALNNEVCGTLVALDDWGAAFKRREVIPP